MFKPEERQIYNYHDGRQERSIDPVVVELGLRENKLDYYNENKLLSACSQELPPGMDAEAKEKLLLANGDIVLKSMRKIADAAAKVFGIALYSEDHPDGWTVRQLVQLTQHYFEWAEDIAKKNEAIASLSEPTDSPLDTSSITPPISPSIEIVSESSCNVHSTSPEVSASTT